MNMSWSSSSMWTCSEVQQWCWKWWHVRIITEQIWKVDLSNSFDTKYDNANYCCKSSIINILLQFWKGPRQRPGGSIGNGAWTLGIGECQLRVPGRSSADKRMCKASSAWTCPCDQIRRPKCTLSKCDWTLSVTPHNQNIRIFTAGNKSFTQKQQRILFVITILMEWWKAEGAEFKS